MEIKGYKVFNPDWTCRGFQYEVGKTFEMEETPVCCDRGFHFCKKASDCFRYYNFNSNNKVAEVTALGLIDNSGDGDKSCTNKIRIDRELTWHEVLDLVNLGKDCTGLCNSGNCNSGNRNSGNWNSGDCNSGNRNSGDWNSGNCNSGNCNSGDCNSGDWNSGDWNKASFCLGCFNTVNQKLKFFDKESDVTFEEWRNSDAYYLLRRIDDAPVEWIWDCDMSDQEKADNPDWEINGGYLKKRDVSQANIKWWKSLSKLEKEEIKNIPNFDAEKFKLITGIDVNED
ncbi:pentapeptide repeat-containing protein [Massilimicrobiota timonensis]|uniref:DUF7666 domain-containing protein n=1 Tax=Massilimicrobiota timonensis TaxID=1776392 RepID=A0A1Y4SSU1_9FIRM|nr:pentapeptide repeat-containing protein [Massilimicrobiota timonensis]OUQ32061.1 hypothetical protein B5E75_12675 [Massilimicrobiota timonensis]